MDKRKEAMCQEDSFFDSQEEGDVSDSDGLKKVENARRKKKRRPVLMTEKMRLMHLSANRGISGIALPNPVTTYYQERIKTVRQFIVPDGYDERIVISKRRGRGRPRKYPNEKDVQDQQEELEKQGAFSNTSDEYVTTEEEIKEKEINELILDANK